VSLDDFNSESTGIFIVSFSVVSFLMIVSEWGAQGMMVLAEGEDATTGRMVDATIVSMISALIMEFNLIFCFI